MSNLEPLDQDTLPWGKIISHAVHDMRNPLSSMRTTLEVLRLTDHDPGQRTRLLTLLDRQVDQLTTLVSHLGANPAVFIPDERPPN